MLPVYSGKCYKFRWQISVEITPDATEQGPPKHVVSVLQQASEYFILLIHEQHLFTQDRPRPLPALHHDVI